MTYPIGCLFTGEIEVPESVIPFECHAAPTEWNLRVRIKRSDVRPCRCAILFWIGYGGIVRVSGIAGPSIAGHLRCVVSWNAWTIGRTHVQWDGRLHQAFATHRARWPQGRSARRYRSSSFRWGRKDGARHWCGRRSACWRAATEQEPSRRRDGHLNRVSLDRDLIDHFLDASHHIARCARPVLLLGIGQMARAQISPFSVERSSSNWRSEPAALACESFESASLVIAESAIVLSGMFLTGREWAAVLEAQFGEFSHRVCHSETSSVPVSSSGSIANRLGIRRPSDILARRFMSLHCQGCRAWSGTKRLSDSHLVHYFTNARVP